MENAPCPKSGHSPFHVPLPKMPSHDVCCNMGVGKFSPLSKSDMGGNMVVA